MEQTVVKQFFPTVKKSFPTHPAKRRKVSATAGLEECTKSPRRTAAATKTSARLSRTKKSVDMSISQLLAAAPVGGSSLATSNQDQHGELRRKAPRKKRAAKTTSTTPSRQLAEVPASIAEDNSGRIISSTSRAQSEQTIEVPASNTDDNSSRGSLKINPWISEQAKLVLHQSRGKATVLASKTQGLPSQKSLKPSDVLMNKSKDAPVNKGNVREDCAKKFQESCKAEMRGRGRLRQKFAHLIAASEEKAASTDCSAEKKLPNNEPADPQSSTTKVPAHKKYKTLTKEKPPTTFTLPQKFKHLLEIFRCVDSVIFLLNRRSEVCTFDRLKKSVQSMLGKKFTEKHLSQLKTVYPKGFTFRIEKNLRDLNGTHSGPQVTIEANYEDVLVNKPTDIKAIHQTVLITRKNLFEASLVDLTKIQHQKFLHKLNLKLAEGEFHRWHPHFKLEEVPDIQESTLPQVNATKTYTSAKDMLEKTRGIPQVEKALDNVAKSSQLEENKSKTEKDQLNETNASTSTATTSARLTGKKDILKGVSASILERIRQKELKKAELAMLRNPEQEARLGLMNRLPDFVRILKTYFVTERKAAITLEDCVIKLMESFGTVSSTEKTEEHIRLLNELVPEWLHIVNVRKCPYVKLAKNYDVNIVLKKLELIKSDEIKDNNGTFNKLK